MRSRSLLALGAATAVAHVAVRLALGAAPAESPAPATEPIPYLLDGKWGFADAAGKLVIPNVYDEAERFRDGRARVQRDGLFGFLDPAGRVAVPLHYTAAGSFSEGLARVGLDAGEVPGVAVGVGKDRRPALAALYGYVDRDGRLVVPIEYGAALPFEGGVAKIATDIGKGAKWGFVSASGGLLVPPGYAFVEAFSEGLAAVYFEDEIDHRAFGFIDRSGKLVLPRQPYDGGGVAFREGRCLVRRGGKWGFIDATGAERVAPVWDDASPFSEGLARVYRGGRAGFIDLDGKVVIPVELEDAGNFFEGLAEVRVGLKRGFIDRTGKLVIPLLADWNRDEICADWIAREGLIKFVADRKYGFMDRTGKVVIAPQYQCAWSFSEGLAGVELDGQWGFIDPAGKTLIPFKYFRIDRSFDRGYAYVTVKVPPSNWNEGYIDKQGREFFAGAGRP